MLVNIGLFTYLVASVSFGVLAVLLALSRRSSPLGISLLCACVATAVWAAIVATGSASATVPTLVIYLSELARNGCWLFVLLQLLGLQSDGSLWSIGGRRWRWGFFAVLGAALLLIALDPWMPPGSDLTPGLHYQLVVVLWLVLALLGLLLIEQLYGNSSQNARWSIKYLCLGLGAILAYDFFMYAEALLFRQLDAELWHARGLVNALATPLLAVAISRNSNWQANLHISRQVVFHTVTLMGAGLYLLGMAAAGYFIRFMGGSWGGVLQIGFMAAAAALLIVLLFSGKLRAQIRVFLSKHFFSYRYDYRQEWLKFTQELANLNDSVAEGIIRIMAPLASSPAGMLWASDEGQRMHLLAHWQMPPPGPDEGLEHLPAWLQERDWVIDLDEWRRAPDTYSNLQLPSWLTGNEQLWLVIPLVFRDRLEAVLILKKSALKHSINWEDRDLLKTAGRQAATHLAQYRATNALMEARQFAAFNRLSAYVVHDLKNILAQQSLIVSNAAKHRNNPAFVDDMISTVENSVTRMQRLMEQMRSGSRSAPVDSIPLANLLREVIQGRSGVEPVPSVVFNAPEAEIEGCRVEADQERLATVFSHLIQNAQEATSVGGTVTVRLTPGPQRVRVDIEDNGRGMDAGFIRDRLFQPFESTKGLTGMGIGVFESRDYIRQLGGDISVTSTPGQGTTFQVSIPCKAAGAEATASAPQYSPRSMAPPLRILSRQQPQGQYGNTA